MAQVVHYCEAPISPEIHAEKFAEKFPEWAGIVFVYGLGSGPMIRALRKRMKDAILVVLEPDQAHAASFGPVIMAEDPKTKVVHRFEDMRNSYAAFTQRHRGVNFIPLPGYREAYPRHFHEYIERLHKEIATISGDQITALRFSLEWQRNTILNLAHVLDSAPVKRTARMWAGKPGVVLSAGPTLGRDLEAINRIQDKAWFVSCGTNSPLISSGRLKSADLIMAFDGGVDNYRAHFRGVDCDVPLVYDTICHHRIVEDWKGPKMLMSVWPTELTFDKWLGEPPGFIAIGPTVAISVVDLLVKMGCNPIIFCGQDLAFVGEKTHVEGTSTDPDRDYGVRGSKIANIPGVNGELVKTDWSSVIFSHALEGYIGSHPEIRWINTSMEGAKIRGTEDMPIEKVESDVLTKDYAKDKRALQAWMRAPAIWEKQNLKGHVRRSIHECYRLLHRIKDRSESLEPELRRVNYSMFWFALQAAWFGHHSGRDDEYVRKEAWDAVTFTMPLLQRVLDRL